MYCIVSNSVANDLPNTYIFTNVTFELDGYPAGTYTHSPNVSASQYEYNVTVFSRTDLENEQHTLVITAALGLQPSLMLFDWAMYT